MVKPALIPERDDAEVLAPKDARKRLEEGNTRFVTGLAQHPDQSAARRKALADGEAPFAAVLSCADSRVPPELVFDQGLGDLYVVRSAGPVVDRALLGSLQFGISTLQIPLLVVLGHTSCSAVSAAIDAVKKKSAASGSDVDTIIEGLRPAVVDAVQSGAGAELVVPAAVSNNVDNVVTQLKNAKVIEASVKAGKLRIIGGVFDMDTGEVTFS